MIPCVRVRVFNYLVCACTPPFADAGTRHSVRLVLVAGRRYQPSDLTCFSARVLRSLNKQIKDKREQIDRLSEDLTKDAEKKVQLERRIEVSHCKLESHVAAYGDWLLLAQMFIVFFFCY